MKAAAGGTDQKVELAPAFLAELPSLQLRPMGARARSENPPLARNDRLVLHVSAGAGSGSSVFANTQQLSSTSWRKFVSDVPNGTSRLRMGNLMRAMAGEFRSNQRQFRNVQTVELQGISLP
jgi:hypothetical protein